MKVAFFGDTHGHLELMWNTAVDWQMRNGRLDFIVQIGDFGIWPTPEGIDKATRYHMEKDGMKVGGDFQDYLAGLKQIPIPTYFIRGNHEDQEYLRKLELQQQELSPHKVWNCAIEILPNLLYIPDGYVVDILGVRFAGWGGNFAYKTWKQDMSYWRTDGRRLNHMTRDRFERLIRSQFDVLLTHDAPIGSGVVGKAGVDIPYDEQTGNGCPPIRDLIDHCQPRYQINGHWHEYHKNQFGRTEAYVLDKVSPRMDVNRSMLVLEL